MSEQLHLTSPMSSDGAPDSTRARWVGQIDAAQLDGAIDSLRPIVAVGGELYARARVLVRDGALVRGFVDVALTDGTIDAVALAGEALVLPAAESRPEPAVRPTVTVIVCTRDRASILAAALDSILALDYPDFDVVVVDNASATSATSDLVTERYADSRITLVSEPVAGLARARNTGLAHATGEVVAFTDDDVIVDAGWLEALAAGFARSTHSDAVVGLVPSGELRTRVQSFFDERVTWAHNLVPRVFSMDKKPADLPTFPFSVGQFGTGANFALRRSSLAEIGEFDIAFGVGTRTGGGEDIDMFTRVLLNGRTLVVEPSAIVWHRHRADIAALEKQAEGYGVGLGAWLTKLALDPETLPLVAGRAGHGLLRLFSIGKGGGAAVVVEPNAAPASAAELAEDAEWATLVKGLGALELRSVLKGPGRYALQRITGQRVRREVAPLPAPSTVPVALRGRRLTLWGAIAAVAGIAGLLATLPLPSAVQAALVALFVLVGPGAALRTWVTLPRFTTAAVVPGLGLTMAILIPSAMAAAAFWHPLASLGLLALVTAVVGLSRWLPAGNAHSREVAPA